MSRTALTEKIVATKIAKGLKWADVAAKMKMTTVFATSALLGQMTLTRDQALEQARAAFEIHNSPLTENAVLGFELGYSLQEPGRLVIWEAQYGDFINGAQTIIDEFLVSARAKWGQTPSLVLLLPHGYDGQGPDHSSGRPERFLQLAAETNLRLANCTTAAQYFHLLRLQAAVLRVDPLPLIILTPKSLLRHPAAISRIDDFVKGSFREVLYDRPDYAREKVTRVVFCSGKVYYDLLSEREKRKVENVALVRLEQLYPFPREQIRTVVDQYPNLKEVVWAQEEPQNMGAWDFVEPRLREVLPRGRRVVLYGAVERDARLGGPRRNERQPLGALRAHPRRGPRQREPRHAPPGRLAGRRGPFAGRLSRQ